MQVMQVKETKFRILQEMLSSSVETISEDKKVAVALMKPAIEHMKHLLALPDKLTYEKLEDFKETLHLVDSVTSNAMTHGIPEEDLGSSTLFCILYGIHDQLEIILEEKEEEDTKNENTSILPDE